MKKISINIEDSVYKSLASRFPDVPDKDSVVSALARLALTEWELWFSAKLRPKSVPGLTQERMKMIFSDAALYAGKEVSRGVLFNQFNLPYGEASYIERVFAEFDQPTLCSKELTKMITDLEAQLQTWRKDKNKKEDQQFTVEVKKLGQRLLQAAMQQAKDNGVHLAPDERVEVVPGWYYYIFSAQEAEDVLKYVKKLSETYTS